MGELCHRDGNYIYYHTPKNLLTWMSVYVLYLHIHIVDIICHPTDHAEECIAGRMKNLGIP